MKFRAVIKKEENSIKTIQIDSVERIGEVKGFPLRTQVSYG